MQDQDFEELAKKTEGFSRSDISIAVEDGKNVPINTVSTATHFRVVCSPSHKLFCITVMLTMESMRSMAKFGLRLVILTTWMLYQ